VRIVDPEGKVYETAWMIDKTLVTTRRAESEEYTYAFENPAPLPPAGPPSGGQASMNDPPVRVRGGLTTCTYEVPRRAKTGDG
jgi:hypothetical protein